jgi:hypothetical protein
MNLPKGRAHKLLPKYVGPYEIIDAEPTTSNYVLKLPPELESRRIHPRFHISCMCPTTMNGFLIGILMYSMTLGVIQTWNGGLMRSSDTVGWARTFNFRLNGFLGM